MDNNFLKGVKFSPDGTCLLTCNEDNTLRLYEVPKQCFNFESEIPSEVQTAQHKSIAESMDVCAPTVISSVLSSNEGETVYDYAWYPYMNSLDPITCFYASTSRDNPIHIWDAYNGSMRTTFRGIL